MSQEDQLTNGSLPVVRVEVATVSQPPLHGRLALGHLQSPNKSWFQVGPPPFSGNGSIFANLIQCGGFFISYSSAADGKSGRSPPRLVLTNVLRPSLWLPRKNRVPPPPPQTPASSLGRLTIRGLKPKIGLFPRTSPILRRPTRLLRPSHIG